MLSIGLPFPPGPFEIVRGALGHHASRVVVDAQLHQVAEAKELRLVDEIAPAEDLLDSALARAERLAAIPASTYARTKSALRAPARAAYERENHPEALSRLAAEWVSPEMTRRVEKALAVLTARRVAPPPVVVRARLRARP